MLLSTALSPSNILLTSGEDLDPVEPVEAFEHYTDSENYTDTENYED